MLNTPDPATSTVNSNAADAAGSDTPGPGIVQGRDIVVRRPRVLTLIVLRCAYIFGQIGMLFAAYDLLGWRFQTAPCMVLVGLSAALNLTLVLSPGGSAKASARSVAAQLGFDILQFAGLLYFTGGVVNPFALLIIAPVTVAGGALPPRYALTICALALAAINVLALAVTGWAPPSGLTGADGYRTACTMALSLAALFAGGYATWSATEDGRMELALRVTETVLAREQRYSALGALAAAIAHELGTPLATIAVIATEMTREAPEGSLRDDAILMVEQARRCRDILRRLAEKPDRHDSLHERMSLLQFVREIVEAHAGRTDILVEALVTGPPGVTAPDLWRRPEIVHAISAFVENALDFAQAEILITARFDTATVAIEVRDDGPGFAPTILGRLGEPNVTSRPGAEGSRSGHIGMGLGVFIAKTLLERSGARVAFANGPRRGAIVTARWPRSRVEVPAGVE